MNGPLRRLGESAAAIALVPALMAIATAATTVVRDVSYLSTPGIDASLQSLDIHAPAEGAGHPVLVYVHGGGWRNGDKSRVGRKPEYFTGRGWVFVSINYRLLPAGRHPANVDDVAASLAWVHDHIADHGGDPTRIVVMGHSAGAHLAALVATDPRPLERAGKPLTILAGAIPLDTVAYAIRGPGDAGALEGHAEVFGRDPDVQRDASPQEHVRRGIGIPPFLICYTRGNNDQVRPRRAAAETFAATLQAAGVAAEVIDASDRTHREINNLLGDPSDDRVTGRIAAFLDVCISHDAPP
jgi:arylformamidase